LSTDRREYKGLASGSMSAEGAPDGGLRDSGRSWVDGLDIAERGGSERQSGRLALVRGAKVRALPRNPSPGDGCEHNDRREHLPRAQADRVTAR
jgi:hypothetical protein